MGCAHDRLVCGSNSRCWLLSGSAGPPLPQDAFLNVLDELIRWPLLPFLLKVLGEGSAICLLLLQCERLSFFCSEFGSLFFLTALRLYPFLPGLDV